MEYTYLPSGFIISTRNNYNLLIANKARQLGQIRTPRNLMTPREPLFINYSKTYFRFGRDRP